MPKPADQPGMVPYGGPGYFTLPVVRGEMQGQPTLTSAWELSTKEVEEINRSGRLYLTILGSQHPPVLLTVMPPFEREPAAADGGSGG